MSRPSVTVVVCTKDRPTFLPACLRSVASELGPEDELLVMEDGDSKAPAALSQVSGRHTYVHDEGSTKTQRLNRALKIATGELVLTTDDDCEVPSGWVDAMAASFTDAGVGIAFGPVEGIPHHPGSEATVGRPGPAPLTPWTPTHGASMAMRRDAARAAGGYDERLGPGSAAGAGEEPDLMLRLTERGLECVIAEAPLVRHLEWREVGETMETLMRYERGSGAWLGAALRRQGRQAWPLLRTRLRYQREVLTRPEGGRGPWFGIRAGLAFTRGLVLGLTYNPRSFI